MEKNYEWNWERISERRWNTKEISLEEREKMGKMKFSVSLGTSMLNVPTYACTYVHVCI